MCRSPADADRGGQRKVLSDMPLRPFDRTNDPGTRVAFE